MDPETAGRQYDKIATRWLEPQLQGNGIEQLKRAIRFTQSRGPALDIGCGCSGRFIELLSKHGFAPEGLDISRQMVALAKERHRLVQFHEADISKWHFPKKYDFILAWDSTWHLPLNLQEPVLQKICDGLAANGVLVFTTGGLDDCAEKSDAFMGVELSYSVLGIPKTLELLDRFDCVCRHLEFDQYPENHLYIIAQKRAR